MDNPNICITLPQPATQNLTDPAMAMYWWDLNERIVWINEEIEEGLLLIADYLMYFNKEDKGLPVELRKPIKLLINSPGGDLDVAETLINLIKISKTPVYTYNVGMAASAASLIYLSGHKRFALPNSSWVFHQGNASMSGDYDSLMKAAEDYQKTIAKMVDFYIERTKIPEETIRQKIKQDWYLYADEESRVNGVYDELITDLDDII